MLGCESNLEETKRTKVKLGYTCHPVGWVSVSVFTNGQQMRGKNQDAENMFA